jgi:hypothetical protein
MQTNRSKRGATTRQAELAKVRYDARRFVDALADRLRELAQLASLAKQFNVFNAYEYAEFKELFLNFRELSEEFQMLSRLAEDSLLNMKSEAQDDEDEHRELDDYFRRLQVPMLHGVISTNLRLLKVWDDRLQRGEGLPYGAYELFLDTVRLIYNARLELLRPRYVALLDEAALRDADRAERLLRTLLERAPQLLDFAAGSDRLHDGLWDEDEGKPSHLAC